MLPHHIWIWPLVCCLGSNSSDVSLFYISHLKTFLVCTSLTKQYLKSTKQGHVQLFRRKFQDATEVLISPCVKFSALILEHWPACYLTSWFCTLRAHTFFLWMSLSGDKGVDELKIGGLFCRLLWARPDVSQRRNSQEKWFTFFQNRGMYMTRLQNLVRCLFVQLYSSYGFFIIIIANAWFVDWVFEMEFPWGKRNGMLSWYIARKKYAKEKWETSWNMGGITCHKICLLMCGKEW